MRIIVCLDDKNGMLFAGRRQSMDRILRQQALLLAGDQPLWMNRYTAKQFAEDGGNLAVDEKFLENAPADAWCFVENTDIMPHFARIRQVAVYRWNRQYPATTWFPMEQFQNRWTLRSSREFSGSSHDVITEEVYAL